jgi:PTH1 family peptidyl-tRNA hydrolase
MRLRVGVGRPERGDPRPVRDYVLSDFDEATDVEALVGRAADAVESIAIEGLERAQLRFN